MNKQEKIGLYVIKIRELESDIVSIAISRTRDLEEKERNLRELATQLDANRYALRMELKRAA